MPVKREKELRLKESELEALIDRALEKQRKELFKHVKDWTGLDPNDHDTGFKIRKAFEFASAAQDGFEKAIKKTVLTGLAAGFLYGIYCVITQMFGRN